MREHDFYPTNLSSYDEERRIFAQQKVAMQLRKRRERRRRFAKWVLRRLR